MEKNLKERLLKVLENYMEITPDMDMDGRLDESGLDSFKAIYLLLDIEEEFQIQIPDDMLSPEIFGSVNALMKLIKSIESIE